MLGAALGALHAALEHREIILDGVRVDRRATLIAEYSSLLWLVVGKGLADFGVNMSVLFDMRLRHLQGGQKGC